MTKLILISAPSGTGKTTMTRLLKSSDNRFRHVQVLTTRAIRPKEVGRGEKVNIILEELEFLDEKDDLINKNSKDDVWYGIKKSAISYPLSQQLTPILEWDLNRLEHFDNFCPTFKVVLEPVNIEEIISRINSDNRDPEGKRTEGMINEVRRIKSGFYDEVSDLRILNTKNAVNDVILKIRKAYFDSLNRLPH